MVLPRIDSKYAVFLSYSGEDREVVQKIAVYLSDEAKLDPWFDQWSLIPGEPWVQNLERGLEASSSCAVFIGRSGQAPWQQPEVEAALRQQVKEKGFRVIPILLPGTPQEPKLPAFLSGNSWVDFRGGLDDDTALWRLECGIRGTPPGPGRPRTEAPPPAPAPPSRDRIEPVNVEIARAERPARVFISYRHREPDNSLAHVFADALRKAGHEVFIDTGLRWGADWVKEIREALERSEFLLLLLSSESGLSEMVVREVALARELAEQRKGCPVILPVRLSLPFTEPLPYQLAVNLHNIHQETWNEPDDTARLVNRLLTTVAEGDDWGASASTPPAAVGQPGQLQPQFDPRSLVIPGGSIKSDSRFYIIRKADNEVFTELQKPRALVTLRGPRQTGKTSLMMGMYVALRRAEERLRTVFVDFQALEDKDLQSRNAIWRAVAAQIAKQLQIREWKASDWKLDDSYISNITNFLDQYVLAQDATPLLLCLDEVDRLFKSPIGSKFFSSVRAFFNDGARDGSSWEKVRWLLGTSSEPSFFIADLRQSPFNVGLRVELGVFTRQEVETLAGRHGLSLAHDTSEEVMNYVGGRPYLTHLLFYHLARYPETRAKLFDARAGSSGIFRDHLHSYLVQFQREEALAKAMRRIINGDHAGIETYNGVMALLAKAMRRNVKGYGCEDARLVERLEAAGLVRRDERSLKVVPACRLYAEFFGSELK
jgi:AAA-like domain/TIR domain